MPIRRALSLPILLVLLAVPACAQAAGHASGGGRRGLLLAILTAIVGLVLGIVLGGALKKAPPAPVQEEKPGKDNAFEDAPVALAVVDTGERIMRANSRFLSLFSLSKAEGTSFPQFLHPDDLPRDRTLLHDVYGGDRPSFDVQTRFFRSDGVLIHGQLSVKRQGSRRKPDSVLVGIIDESRRIEAETELEGSREAIHALYDVIAGDKSRDLDGKMRSLLAMGCGRFELPIGSLGRFVGDEFETLFVNSPDRRVRPALKLNLNDGSTLEAELLGIPHLPDASNWASFPFIARNDTRAYLGSPVLVSGQLFGMLSFAKADPRHTDFSSADIELLQLMAEWVGGEIERENARSAIERKQQELLEANAKLESLATHDPLTEVKNRRAFNEKLVEEWSRATRYGTALGLIMIDVDHFKSYNDTFGHPAGDVVLKRVAQLLGASVRGTDFLARYGGEEFVLLLPNTDPDGAMILGERLRQKVEGGGWKERPVTVSVGVASLVPGMKEPGDLTSAADHALYFSKDKGRNKSTHIRSVDLTDTSIPAPAG